MFYHSSRTTLRGRSPIFPFSTFNTTKMATTICRGSSRRAIS